MTSGSAVPERELTHSVVLTRPDGRLARDAVGWARHPFVDTSGIGRGFWGRNKRWDYWNITTPTHIFALTVSSMDYAAVHEVWVLDRETEQTWGRAVTTLPARGFELAPSLEHGRTRARAKGLSIDIDDVVPVDGGQPRGTRLRAAVGDASFDVVAALPVGHERLAVVVPWSDTRFQYTVKDIARPASGMLTVDGRTFEVPRGRSWAVLDHGRGRWPYDMRWNRGAAAGESYGRVIGLQVGGRWTAGTGTTENAVLVDGVLHKIHDEVEWEYDINIWRQPWRVSGGGLEAIFSPFYDKVSRTNLGIVAGSTDQCFGYWSGTYWTADREAIPFDGLLGWAEHVHNRW